MVNKQGTGKVFTSCSKLLYLSISDISADVKPTLSVIIIYEWRFKGTQQKINSWEYICQICHFIHHCYMIFLQLLQSSSEYYKHHLIFSKNDLVFLGISFFYLL